MSVHRKIRSFILSNLVSPDNRMIGMEEECILHNMDGKRIPVNLGDEFSATDMLCIMNDKIGANGEYSLEPGGQLEWSSPPFSSLNDLQLSMEAHHALLSNVVLENNLKLIDYGLDPITSPEEINLIDKKKYQLMNKSMEKNGSMGKWMMRNTASIQVSFDIISEEDMEEMAFVADCLHPIAAYLFANSPYQNGKATELKNIRNIIWENTDKHRCRSLFDHAIGIPNGLVDRYIEYILKVQSIFKLDLQGEVESSDKRLGEVLQNLYDKKCLKDRDIQAALHQIFTNVRLKSLVEVRGADRTPRGYEMAPVAFWTGLLMENNARTEAYKVLMTWNQNDRKLFNKAGLSLDKSQPGPKGKTYGEWIKWGGELALNGLRRRGLKEEVLFDKFFNNVISLGPFSLQVQHNESTYNS